jgi:hydroxymethylglutaryl-CoA reductase (NADPH)
MHRELIAQQLELALRASLDAPALRLIELEGERPASGEVREPWIPIKYGPASADDWFGVVPATARFERARGSGVEVLGLVAKVNPRQGLARTLIPWIIAQKNVALDRPYWEYRGAAEFDHTSAREQHLYELANDTPALRRVLPRCYGNAVDAASGEHALFLEFVSDVTRLDATGGTADWPAAAIDDALRAAASCHAAFWDIDGAHAAWAGPRPTTPDMIADAPLWRGLLDDARARFPDLVTDKVWRRRRLLIETLPDWHPAKDRLPATLVHDDFNQRNVGFRPNTVRPDTLQPSVVVLDWELVERNIAQRDLVEMLTFVLPASADRSQVDRYVEAHRTALIAAGVATGIERDAWIEGFRCELKVEAINRVAHHFLFAAQFPLAYLARINATMERLLDLYG